MPSPTMPDYLRAVGVQRVCDLDVRPLLARGEPPFDAIMRAADGLAGDEALHLVAPFAPHPLYDVMRRRGCSAYTRTEGDVIHVWFYRAAS